MNAGDPDDRTYSVVVNQEVQYSIWEAATELPRGWKEVGMTGTKAECLTYIEQVWTDIRPLSLRKSIEDLANRK